MPIKGINNKKGEMGIGTLIVFIAMILVAAIAAGVLIRTATSLQSKALLTGERSKEQVSTALDTILLTASDGSTGNSVDYFEQTIRLAPGSGPIKFNETVIEFDTTDISADLVYNGTKTNCNAGNGYGTSGTSGYYTVVYVENGTLAQSDYLQGGDLVKICYQSPRAITEDDLITVSIIPKVGNVEQIDTATPSTITDQTIVVYP